MFSLSSRSEPSFLAALGVVMEYECSGDEKCKRKNLLLGTAVAMEGRGLQSEAVTLSHFCAEPHHIEGFLEHCDQVLHIL
jgi:hypothetical protein